MRRWAAAVLLGAGVGLLALPACGGKTDETARAAGITPRQALGFFSVNLSPSIEQQRNLKGIVDRFPGAPSEIRGDFEDVRDELLDVVSGEAGLDYATDVKPWLGNEVALALLPLAEGEDIFDEPPVVAMFETDDPGKATAALEKAAGSGDFDAEYRVVEDFVVVAAGDEGQADRNLDLVEAAAKADKGGLAEDERFTSVVDDLAGDRLLLAWADGQAISELLGAGEFLGDIDDFGLPFPFLRGLSEDGVAAADLHAERSALVVRAVSVATGEEPGGGEPALTAALPADVLGALTLFNVGRGVEQALRFVAGFGGGDIDDLSVQLGLDIQADVLSWMEGELAIVAGPVPSGGEFPSFALVVEPTDTAKAAAGLDKIAGLLEDQGFPLDREDVAGASAYVVPVEFLPGIAPAMALFEDRFVLASTIELLEQLAEDASPSLGGTEAYQSVIGEGSRTGTSFQLIVRIDPIREAIEAALAADELRDYEREAQANIEPLDTFGMFARRDGDRNRFEMKLTVS